MSPETRHCIARARLLALEAAAAHGLLVTPSQIRRVLEPIAPPAAVSSALDYCAGQEPAYALHLVDGYLTALRGEPAAQGKSRWPRRGRAR